MTTTCRLLCTLLISVVWTAVFAKEPEIPQLFAPVDTAVVNNLELHEDFAARDSLYFAKRYRVVRLNVDAVTAPAKQMRVDLFGKSLEVESDPLTRGDGYALWHGRILTRGGGPITFNRSMSEDQHRRAVDDLYRIQLGTRTYEHVLNDSAGSLQAAESFRLDDGTPPAGAQKILVTTASGEWNLFDDKTLIRVVPLESDPRYHLLIEVDREKHGEGPDRQQRVEEYRRFREQLTKEWREKKRNQ